MLSMGHRVGWNISKYKNYLCLFIHLHLSSWMVSVLSMSNTMLKETLFSPEQ